MFEIDFKRLVALLLPPALRRPLIFGWLRVAVGALERQYAVFSDMRAGHVFRLTHNGQVLFARCAQLLFRWRIPYRNHEVRGFMALRRYRSRGTDSRCEK